MDDKFKLLREFINNMQFKHEGISNLYVFETRDKEGNVTDVKYGMNLLTDVGLDAIYKNGGTFALSNSVGLYAGTFTGNFDKTGHEIIEPAFDCLRAENNSTTKDFRYPIIYNPGLESDTGIITLVSKLGVARYPYDITNHNYDVSIFEYGIGTAYNNLWTHAHIYNNQGEATYITKRAGQEMFIHIYMCLSLYEHVIMNAWQDNTFIGLTTGELMFQRCHVSNMGTYKRASVYDRTSSGITKTVDDLAVPGTLRSISLLQEFTMADSYGSGNSYIDGFWGSCGGLIIIDRQYLPVVSGVQQTETFTLTGYKASDPLNTSTPEDAINANIGKDITTQNDWNKNLYPQFTTMMDIDVKTFSVKTGDWANNTSVPFYNDNDFQYSNAGFETAYCRPIHYWSNTDILTTAYLFINIFPENPILSINHGHESVYATDKYWDISTWVPINNFDEIPVSVRSAKYWIVSKNDLAIIPKRQKHGFELLDPTTGDTGFRDYNLFGTISRTRPSVDNPTYQWLAIGGNIYTFGRQRVFTYDANVYEQKLFTYGRWLICVSASTTTRDIRCIDTTTANDEHVDPTIFQGTRQLEFTSNLNPYNQAYITETNTGWVVFQSLVSNIKECVIWDLRGATINAVVKSDWVYAAAIWGTHFVAYRINGESYIHIYNLETGQDAGSSIQVPNNNVVSLCGVDNIIWFSNNSNTYYVDLTTPDRQPVQCGRNAFGNVARGSDSYLMTSTGISKSGDMGVYMMWYQGDQSTSYDGAKVLIFNTDDPYTINDMTGFTSQVAMQSYAKYCKLRYIGDTLFCLFSSTYSKTTTENFTYYMVDMGRYIKTGTAIGHWRTSSNGEAYATYLYGDYIFKNLTKMFPIQNALPFKITGKTKTINSTNVLKHIKNKRYVIGYTNAPLWGKEINNSGKPPGKPQPKCDADGNIYAWDYS